jgi:hypothetical protein
LCCHSPVRFDGVCVFKHCDEIAEWHNSKLNLRDEFAIKLFKTNMFCNITDNLRFRPVF